MHKHVVQYYETDMMGVTHHSNYVRWMEEARTEYLRKLGFPYSAVEDGGLISPIVSMECSFKKTTTFEDVIYIKAEVYEFKGVKLKFRYTMTKEDGTIVFTAKSEHCFLSKDGKIISLAKTNPDLYKLILDELVE